MKGSNKTTLLIFSDWYDPAFKAGGPIRSIVNFVEIYKNDFEIHVFTSDRDLGDENAFENIQADVWINQDCYRIMYASPQKVNFSSIKKIIQALDPDWIYLNSMFSKFTYYPLMTSFRSGKIVLAPRGMLRYSALAIKPIRKYLYLSLLRMLNIEHYIKFHATGPDERASIKQIFPNAKALYEAPNLPPKFNHHVLSHKKIEGELNMVFVGRMHPIKNLLYLLHCCEYINGNCSLKIIATNEDEAYWQKCQEKIIQLKGIKIDILLNVPHRAVSKHLEEADLFVLPTKGENFGHAIMEAMAVGCPVLISDQTPWKNLKEKMAGMEISLDDPSMFSSAIQQFIDMADLEWQEYRRGASRAAQQHLQESKDEISYFQLFNRNEI